MNYGKQKIALVHDFFNEAGGAERVLRVLTEMYPEAPIYTSFIKNGSAKEMFKDRQIIESPWGWFLKIGRFYSYFRFLLPFTWRSIDLTNYDLVITSCSSYVARGFKVKESAKVIAYCHTPPKWLYGYETQTDGQKRWWGKMYLWLVGPFVRYFDYVSAQRVNVWIANSQEVARRIDKFYRKKAVVVYPPVEMNYELRSMNYGDENKYYLTVARVVGAKGLELAAQAVAQAKRKLVVVGEIVGGKALEARIMNYGNGYVEMRGRVSDKELDGLYFGARGYLALAIDEDFGMTVIEAMAHGVPVIATNSGGYKETVTKDMGKLIDQLKPQNVAGAMEELEKIKWDKQAIGKWARKFDRAQFEKGIRGVVGA